MDKISILESQVQLLLKRVESLETQLNNTNTNTNENKDTKLIRKKKRLILKVSEEKMCLDILLKHSNFTFDDIEIIYHTSLIGFLFIYLVKRDNLPIKYINNDQTLFILYEKNTWIPFNEQISNQIFRKLHFNILNIFTKWRVHNSNDICNGKIYLEPYINKIMLIPDNILYTFYKTIKNHNYTHK